MCHVHGCVVAWAPPTLLEVKSQCCLVVALVLPFTWHPCLSVAMWEVCSPAILQLCPCASLSAGPPCPMCLHWHPCSHACSDPALRCGSLDSPRCTKAKSQLCHVVALVFLFSCNSHVPGPQYGGEGHLLGGKCVPVPPRGG